MQGIAHAVFQRLAKAQPINHAWAVLIDLGGGRLPPGKAAISKAFDDLSQPRQNRIALEISDAATLGQPRMQAYACSGCGGAVRQPVTPNAVASSPSAAARPKRRAAHWACPLAEAGRFCVMNCSTVWRTITDHPSISPGAHSACRKAMRGMWLHAP